MLQSRRSITTTEFSKHAAEVIAKIEQAQERIQITRFGKSVVEIIPLKPDSAANDIFGCMENTASAKGDLFSTGESWKAI